MRRRRKIQKQFIENTMQKTFKRTFTKLVAEVREAEEAERPKRPRTRGHRRGRDRRPRPTRARARAPSRPPPAPLAAARLQVDTSPYYQRDIETICFFQTDVQNLFTSVHYPDRTSLKCCNLSITLMNIPGIRASSG